MESKMFTVLVLFMLFCVIQQSTALKCYTCSSVTNPECTDVKDKGFLIRDCIVENIIGSNTFSLSELGRNDANGNRGTLIPTCLEVIVESAGLTVVDRSCYIKYQNDDPCAVSPSIGDNLVEHCGACEQDGCNTATPFMVKSR